MSMGIFLHISYLRGIFLTSDLIVFWTILRAETCMGQRAVGFSLLFRDTSIIFLVMVGFGSADEKCGYKYLLSNSLTH